MTNLTVTVVRELPASGTRMISPKREFLTYLLEEYGNDPKIADYATAEIQRMNEKNIQRARQRKARTEYVVGNTVLILRDNLNSGDVVTPLSVRKWLDENYDNFLPNGKRVITLPKIQAALDTLVENGEMTTSIEYVANIGKRPAKQRVYKFN